MYKNIQVSERHVFMYVNVFVHVSVHILFISINMYLCQHFMRICIALQHTATHYNTLQHAATHCNTLQHNDIRRCTRIITTTLRHTATHCNNTLQHTATHCNTLQHTATHCNALQHAFASFLRIPLFPEEKCRVQHNVYR